MTRKSRSEASDVKPTTVDSLPASAAALSPRWDISSERLQTTYRFESFGDAIRFMAACIDDIDRIDHHPDWSNANRRLHVTLTTHSTGCVTGKDLELAIILDTRYERYLVTQSFG